MLHMMFKSVKDIKRNGYTDTKKYACTDKCIHSLAYLYTENTFLQCYNSSTKKPPAASVVGIWTSGFQNTQHIQMLYLCICTSAEGTPGLHKQQPPVSVVWVIG